MGIRKEKVDPSPGWLSAHIFPLWISTKWRDMDNPNPVPRFDRDGSAL